MLKVLVLKAGSVTDMQLPSTIYISESKFLYIAILYHAWSAKFHQLNIRYNRAGFNCIHISHGQIAANIATH